MFYNKEFSLPQALNLYIVSIGLHFHYLELGISFVNST